MKNFIENIKFKGQFVITLLKSLFVPKSWDDLIKIAKTLLKIANLLIQITFVPFVFLIVLSYLSNFIKETPFGYVCIGLIYLYFISLFHLCIWIIIPAWLLTFIDKIRK